MGSLVPYSCVRLNEELRRLGIHVVSGKGTGKSRLLGRIIAFQDVAGRWRIPTIIIDAMGMTINNLLHMIGHLPPDKQREVWERIRLFDMVGRDGYVMSDPFYFRHGTESLPDVADRLIELIGRINPELLIAPLHGMNAVRHIGRYMGIVLAGLGLQITEAESLLRNPKSWEARFQTLKERHPVYEVEQAIHFFMNDYSKAEAASLRSKIADFTLSPINRAMFGASQWGIDWDEVINKRLCVLIDLSGSETEYMKKVKMMWVFYSLLTYITKKGWTRDVPLSLIIDELTAIYHIDDKSLATDIESLSNIKGRNWNVWLTVAHQEMYPFEEHTQKALMSLGTQIIGKTSDPDAAMYFTKKFDRIDPRKVKDEENMYVNFGTSHFNEFYSSNDIGVIDTRYTYFSVPEQLITESYKYMELRPFEFLVQIAGTNGVQRMNIHNYGVYDALDIQTIERVKDVLMRRDGRKIDDIEREIKLRLSSDKALEYEAPQYDIPSTVKKRKAISADDEAFA